MSTHWFLSAILDHFGTFLTLTTGRGQLTHTRLGATPVGSAQLQVLCALLDRRVRHRQLADAHGSARAEGPRQGREGGRRGARGRALAHVRGRDQWRAGQSGAGQGEAGTRRRGRGRAAARQSYQERQQT